MVQQRSFLALLPQEPTGIPIIAGFVDGYVTQEHRVEVNTTTYPVESGSSLTDNAVKQPERLKLTGWVSDLMPSPGVGPGVNLKSRATLAWTIIVQLMEIKRPVTAVTQLRTYRNMLITKAVAPVDVRTGQSLQFTLDLQEILFARTRIVRLPPEVVSGPAQDRTSMVDGGRRLSPIHTLPGGRNSIVPTAVPQPLPGGRN